MNCFFLPSFFDYLQNQPSLSLVAGWQQQHNNNMIYAHDVETASLSTMLLTILLLLSTVEGVVLFFTTLYSWCLFPIHWEEEETIPDPSSSSILVSSEAANGHRHRRRRRFYSQGGGEHYLFWWMDVEYESDSDSQDDDEYYEDETALDVDDDDDGNDIDGRRSDYPTTRKWRRVDRKERIRLSLQERAFQDTTIHDYKYNKNEEASSSCAICLTEFAEGDRVVTGSRPCCRNCFHRNCLEEWLNIQSSCPCCRTNLLLKSKEILSRRNLSRTTA